MYHMYLSFNNASTLGELDLEAIGESTDHDPSSFTMARRARSSPSRLNTAAKVANMLWLRSNGGLVPCRRVDWPNSLVKATPLLPIIVSGQIWESQRAAVEKGFDVAKTR